MTARIAQRRTTDGEAGSSIADYTTVTSTSALSISTAWLRTDADRTQGLARALHEKSRAHDLGVRSHRKATSKDVPALLDELANERGMSWTDIAAAAGVSVSAIRKWRSGGTATADNRLRLAQVAAFLDLLQDKWVPDPAQWMEMQLPLPDGYLIRPIDLYVEGHTDALLELVEGRQKIESILDAAAPGWRDDRSDFEVFADTDGQRSLRRRGA